MGFQPKSRGAGRGHARLDRNTLPTMTRSFRRALPMLFACAITPLTGCAGLGAGGSGGSGAMVSDVTARELELRLPNRAAVVTDENTADVYLTDLSQNTLDRISAGDIPPEVSGTLLHIHIFLNPKPGRTPIEPTAANATARVVVLARGQIGVYDGAGFLLPGKSLRKNSASGTLRNAHTRLSRASEGFEDLLGPTTLRVSFGAKGNEPEAERIARVVRMLTAAADPID
jgi:hypothetical protein